MHTLHSSRIILIILHMSILSNTTASFQESNSVQYLNWSEHQTVVCSFQLIIHHICIALHYCHMQVAQGGNVATEWMWPNSCPPFIARTTSLHETDAWTLQICPYVHRIVYLCTQHTNLYHTQWQLSWLKVLTWSSGKSPFMTLVIFTPMYNCQRTTVWTSA